MYEKLSPRMEQVIKLAQVVAREYGQDYVGTEHLLLAMVREGNGKGARLLRRRSVDESQVRAAVDRLLKQRLEDTWVLGRLPGTPHFRNVIESAIEEARQWEAREIGTEHLLLALLREDGSVAHAALRELGFRHGDVRAALNAGEVT
ncbi:MAG: ATP-dependent Clp protease ATP-binding subunit [Phycisphaerae bacterium]|nr:hypothetical protein [Phycisphaerae bacterium]NUQ47095.1 ATP-dependent Clp protease ATP-binding subunit [Phycisphaerae bacterium]